jgi:hypothetical protein
MMAPELQREIVHQRVAERLAEADRHRKARRSKGTRRPIRPAKEA